MGELALNIVHQCWAVLPHTHCVFILVVYIVDEWDFLKSEPELTKLLDYISRVETKWMEIGLKLGIKPHILDQLKCNYANDGVKVLIVKVLQQWQKNITPPFTWATIIQVLNSEFVGEHVLAKTICDAVLREQVTYGVQV